MTEQDARAALRAQGIKNPSKSLIENWLRVQHSEETASRPEVPRDTIREMQPCISPSLSLEETPGEGRPSSESNLEPVLRDRGELVRKPGPRRAGRPPVVAPWFQAVATAMSDGTPLRLALTAVGVHGLTRKEVRALYRNRVLTVMRREARQKWLREWGVKPKARKRYGCKGGLAFGMSPQLRRLL